MPQPPPPEPRTPPTCPNCGATSVGRFCAGCGQDNARGRLAVRPVLGDALSNLVGWDSALARTLRGLATNPGGLVADYVGGRRRRYVNPARFCLLTLALWLLASRLTDQDPLAAIGIELRDATGGADGSQGQDLDETDPRALIGPYLDLFLYLSLPLRAALVRLFFRRAQRNFAECLVQVLYLAGFGYLFSLLSVGLVALQGEQLLPLFGLTTLFWFTWSSRTFHACGWWAALWRCFVVTMVHLTTTVLLMVALIVGGGAATSEREVGRGPGGESAAPAPPHENPEFDVLSR